MSLWHPTKNVGVNHNSRSHKITDQVWWRCKKGHEWKASIASIIWGNDCPKCRTRPSSVENNLSSTHPEIAKEWHPTKNKPYEPDKVLPMARLKVWWVCKNNHQYRVSIGSRTSTMKSGCIYCAGQKPTWDNNLKHHFPEIAQEWDYEANHPLRPENVLPGKKQKAFWICPIDGSYPATISDRTGPRKSGCPYCSGTLVSDRNRLTILFPEIAAEWHPTKNAELRPEDFSYGSKEKVHWLCKNNHTYEAAINSRTNQGSGCKVCSKQTSKPELRLLAEIKSIFPDADSRYQLEKFEVDVFISKFKIAVEYDGAYFHKNRAAHDVKKRDWIKKKGVKLYRLREAELPCFDANDIKVEFNKSLEKHVIDSLLLQIFHEVDGAHQNLITSYLSKSGFQNEELYKRYLSYYPNPLPENSLAIQRPDIAAEWHPEKNFPLTPENFTVGSNYVAYWVCKDKGCAYPARIIGRTKKLNPIKCSVCAGKHVNSSNSLAAIFPNVASEWHPTKNGNLTANDVTKKSKQEVWWLCHEGHEWKQSIGERTGKKETPCQECKRHQNSVSKKFPKIAAEWHPTKNTNLEIRNFTYGSNEIVWWLCANGHEWKDSIKKRCRDGGVQCQKCKKAKKMPKAP